MRATPARPCLRCPPPTDGRAAESPAHPREPHVSRASWPGSRTSDGSPPRRSDRTAECGPRRVLAASSRSAADRDALSAASTGCVRGTAYPPSARQSCANTRLEVPESPSCSRLPSAASASSTTTTTGPIARRTASTRSRFPSVSPTYFERKFLRTTQGTPISPLTHWARNDLPVPTGPQSRYPIGRLSSAPRLSNAASSRSRAFAAAWPTTVSRVHRGSMNSSRP